MPGWFYKAGKTTRSVGRKGRWVWQNMAGSEEDQIKAEYAAGIDLAKEFETEAPILTDDVAAKMVNQISSHMVQFLKNKHRKFRFRVVLLPEPNAFALPGGFIFVTRALLELCGVPPLPQLPESTKQELLAVAKHHGIETGAVTEDDPVAAQKSMERAIIKAVGQPAAAQPTPTIPPQAFDEVAFILGHEMAHVMRGHAMARMVNSTVVNAATQTVAKAAAIGGLMGRVLFGAGSKFLHSAYSQDQELEADELGARLSAASGYDPRAALSMLRRLEQVSGGDSPIDLDAYFSTHPPFDVRIRALDRLIKT